MAAFLADGYDCAIMVNADSPTLPTNLVEQAIAGLREPGDRVVLGPALRHARRPRLRGGLLEADLCVIGAGSGGLSVGAGAVQMGASIVLIEKHLMGGECLNTGCVPSKALLAAAHAAQEVRGSTRFGGNGHEPAIDFAKVHAHVHGVIAAIAPHDSVERF